MEIYGEKLAGLISEFERMPGIGAKTAERLAHYVLALPKEEAMRLAQAIRDVKEKIHHCSICYNLSEGDVCPICADPERDPSTVCVVEQVKDLLAIEKTRTYRGRYHVLLGSFAPLEGVGPEDLTIQPLLARLEKEKVREVIIATNPNYEGDGTALYLSEKLKGRADKVTRIARGIPAGSHLEYVSKTTVSHALEGRREMD